MSNFISELFFDELVEETKELTNALSALCDDAIQTSMTGLGGCKNLDYSGFPEWQQSYEQRKEEKQS